MPVITCNEDLRRLARRRAPRAIFDYADRGSYEELTLRANRSDLDALRLRQRGMVDVSTRSLRCRMAGQDCAVPVPLAPTGLTGLLHADGEILAARAGQGVGMPFTLSTMSVCSVEAVRGA